MKKVLCLILSLLLAFCVVGCAKKPADKLHSVDIEKYANQGKLSNLGFAIGDDVKSTADALKTANVDESGEAIFNQNEKGDYTVISDGVVSCCYKTDDQKKGLTHIVYFGGSYGFELGDVSTGIRDTMAELGFDAKERDAKKDELFFMPQSDDMTVLEYSFKKNTVLFIFQNNALSAVCICAK